VLGAAGGGTVRCPFAAASRRGMRDVTTGGADEPDEFDEPDATTGCVLLGLGLGFTLSLSSIKSSSSASTSSSSTSSMSSTSSVAAAAAAAAAVAPGRPRGRPRLPVPAADAPCMHAALVSSCGEPSPADEERSSSYACSVDLSELCGLGGVTVVTFRADGLKAAVAAAEAAVAAAVPNDFVPNEARSGGGPLERVDGGLALLKTALLKTALPEMGGGLALLDTALRLGG